MFVSLSLFAQVYLVSSPKNSQPLFLYLILPFYHSPLYLSAFSLRKSPYPPGFCTCTLRRYFYSRFSTILAFGIIAIILFKIWANPDLFFHLFLVFSIKIYKFLQQIYVKKCQSTTRCQDLNPQPSECESPPITTRPGLPPHCYYSFLYVFTSVSLLMLACLPSCLLHSSSLSLQRPIITLEVKRWFSSLEFLPKVFQTIIRCQSHSYATLK